MNGNSKINTVKKALAHLEYKFKNHWKPSPSDIQAFNTLSNLAENTAELQMCNNMLFAKLYVIFYGELLKFYGTTVMDPIPTKELHRALSQSWESIVQKFVYKANEQEIYCRMRASGIDLGTHPRLKPETILEKEKGKFSMDMLEPATTYEDAENNLKALINGVLENI